MRKKELFERLNGLADSVEDLNRELKKYKQENSDLRKKVAALQSELEAGNSEQPQPAGEPQGFTVQPLDTDCNAEAASENTPKEMPVLADEAMEYGSGVIGRIILEAAGYADRISSSDCSDKKDLLNLIMGKSEVCKAEILNIAMCEASNESKRSLMDSQLTEAVDYFKSVTGQL